MKALTRYFSMSKLLLATGVAIGYGVGVAYVNPQIEKWIG